MKKIQKNDLRLDKEVISSLTSNDLGSVKGGLDWNTVAANTCNNCKTKNEPACVVTNFTKLNCKDTQKECDPDVTSWQVCYTAGCSNNFTCTCQTRNCNTDLGCVEVGVK